MSLLNYRINGQDPLPDVSYICLNYFSMYFFVTAACNFCGKSLSEDTSFHLFPNCKNLTAFDLWFELNLRRFKIKTSWFLSSISSSFDRDRARGLVIGSFLILKVVVSSVGLIGDGSIYEIDYRREGNKELIIYSRLFRITLPVLIATGTMRSYFKMFP
jgi:hypothetical protein